MPRGITIVNLGLIMVAAAAMAGEPSPPVIAGSTDGDGQPSVAGATPAGPSPAPPAPASPQSTPTRPSAECGIEPLSLRLTANGYMLDFRYRVLDPEKASVLFDHKTKPYLEDQETGAKFIVPEPPKVGALRTSRKPKEGTTCFMLFANPGRYISPGETITIVAGDLRVQCVVEM